MDWALVGEDVAPALVAFASFSGGRDPVESVKSLSFNGLGSLLIAVGLLLVS